MFDFTFEPIDFTFDLADYTFDPADFTSYTVNNSENGIGCVTCGGASPAPTGRRRYCCNAARQRAYRRRRRLLARAIGREAARRRWVDYRTPFPPK